MIAIKSGGLQKVIFECFKEDKELVDRWHIEAGKGLKKCVERTVKDLQLCDNYTFYVIKDIDNNVAGWFGIEQGSIGKFLTGFFLKPKLRTKENKEWLIKTVKNITNDTFFSGIYKRNERASKFLTNMGGELVYDKNDILIYKFLKSCP